MSHAPLALVVAVALAAGRGPRVTPDANGVSHDGYARVAPAPAVKATTELCEGTGAKRRCFSATAVLDGDGATAWCEGAEGDGVGQALTFSFGAATNVSALWVLPYYAKDLARARNNGRVKTLEVRHDRGAFTVELPDVAWEERCVAGPCGDETCDEKRGGDEICFPAEQRITDGEGYFLEFPAVTTKQLRLTVKAVHGGDKYEDLCVSSVSLFGKKG